MMKNKFAVKASLFTLILALLAIGTYAAGVVMKNDNDKKEVKFTTTWFYKGGNSNAEILNVDNWERSDTGSPHEQCDQGTDLPCSVNNAPENESDFQDYLNSRGVSGIMQDSPTKRPYVTP
ncbi:MULTISPECIES: hypothetical protein [Sphingobacterium]|uniref:hypothetical protein n=1 Tax=Sphingobacterium TaxID=28453 RepID=UPI00257F48A2|nr:MULTISPECIES: hypothetical protein [Sphingobacterium]